MYAAALHDSLEDLWNKSRQKQLDKLEDEELETLGANQTFTKSEFKKIQSLFFGFI